MRKVIAAIQISLLKIQRDYCWRDFFGRISLIISWVAHFKVHSQVARTLSRSLCILKMSKKKVYVIGIVVVCYIVLILLFFKLKNERSFRKVCEWNSSCIRFCCFNQITCNDKFIRENFNASVFSKREYDSESQIDPQYKIMFGNPKCSLIPLEDEDEFELTKVFTINFFCELHK